MYQFSVSGAARGESVEEGRQLATELGKALAKAGHSLLTGATTGLPNYASEGYKAAGGKMCVGISPAGSKVEHILKYRLPTQPMTSSYIPACTTLAVILSLLHQAMRSYLSAAG